VKISVSLPDEDVAYLDAYAKANQVDSRSAVLQQAVRLLRVVGLADDYEAALAEWQTSDDALLWDAVVADGMDG